MTIVGYKLVDAEGTEIQSWGGVWGQLPGVPNPIRLPNGDDVHAPEIGVAYQGYTLVPIEMESPVLGPRDFPLADWQLRLGLLENGYDVETIEASIKAIPDPVERQRMWTWWDRPTIIKWDNPTTQEFLIWLGIPTEYAKDMWMEAKDLSL